MYKTLHTMLNSFWINDSNESKMSTCVENESVFTRNNYKRKEQQNDKFTPTAKIMNHVRINYNYK